jgi:hypothetical protein
MEIFPVPTGMVVLTAIALAVAAACHWRIRGFWRACLVSAVVTPVLFLIACVLQAGLPDPLEPKALLLFSGYALMVAIVMGMVAALARRLAPARA